MHAGWVSYQAAFAILQVDSVKVALQRRDFRTLDDELFRVPVKTYDAVSYTHLVVIEEFLSGIECSVFVMTDGRHYKVLPVAKDYKRIGEGDKGLNTGGMGSVTPVPFADETFMEKVRTRIIEPVSYTHLLRNLSEVK